MICFPNAKINLGLHITEKRKDGYHNIESVFYPIPFCDVLEVIPSDIFEYNQTGQILDCGVESNLVVKAYRLLQQDYSLPNVKIHLHKLIPSGAGLGGGSANAAFMINLLNDLFQLNISLEKRKAFASILGSDCTFFIENKPAFVTGVGHDIDTIDLSLKGYQLVVVNPNIHISTAFAYSKIVPKASAIDLKRILIDSEIKNWKSELRNDFETPMMNEFPKIEEIKVKLYKLGALYASMTGSGSTLFGIFDKSTDINFQEEFLDCFVWSKTI